MSEALFRANIGTIRCAIRGCPAEGPEALDFRRARGLEERLDNRLEAAVQADLDELTGARPVRGAG